MYGADLYSAAASSTLAPKTSHALAPTFWKRHLVQLVIAEFAKALEISQGRREELAKRIMRTVRRLGLDDHVLVAHRQGSQGVSPV
jgi:hypothetical protein